MWCLANGVLKFIAAFAINIVSWVQPASERDAIVGGSERERDDFFGGNSSICSVVCACVCV